MKFTTLALAILCVFAIIGGAVTSVALHEISHKYDFKNIEKTNEKLCLLNYPTNEALGYYSFDVLGQSAEIAKIEKNTELRSYAITAAVLVLLTVCLVVGLLRFKELVSVEKEQEQFWNKLGLSELK